MFRQFLSDECGMVVSTEAVLIATVLILGMIVGLSSIQQAIVAELNDVGDGLGNTNQSFYSSGFSKGKLDRSEIAAYSRGSASLDTVDEGDNDQCEIACDLPVAEAPKAP